MKNRILFTLMLLLISNPSWATGKVGNGGVDVILPSGEIIPIETYIANQSDPIVSVCDMMKGIGTPEDDKAWRNSIDNTLKAIYEKQHHLAYDIVNAFGRSRFYFITLDDSAQIRYTGDDGKIIEVAKANGAIRVGDDVYILSSIWKNYWEHHNATYPFQNMMTRIFHEALLYHYSDEENSKYNLGKAVVEILRLAGHYENVGGQPSEALGSMSPDQIQHFLNKNGLSFNLSKRFDIYEYDKKEIANKTIKEGTSKNWNDFVKKADDYKKFLTDNKINLINPTIDERKTPFFDDTFELYSYNDTAHQIDLLSTRPAYFVRLDEKTGQPYQIEIHEFNKKQWDRVKPILTQAPTMCSQ